MKVKKLPAVKAVKIHKDHINVAVMKAIVLGLIIHLALVRFEGTRYGCQFKLNVFTREYILTSVYFAGLQGPSEKGSTLKKRICSHWEQIVSFYSTSLFRREVKLF